MRRNGSQTIETLSESGYRLVATWPDVDRGSVVMSPVGDENKRELWFHNQHAACYVIEIEGRRYEFARTL